MSTRRFIVGEEDGTTVGGIVALAAPGDARAIAEGRVFIGRRRAQDAGDAVAVGDEVLVASAVEDVADEVRVLARGKRWVAVDKPAGTPTIPDHGGASHTLVALAARAVGLPPARLHATSRLDRDVSGVVIFALDAEMATRLRREREEHRYARRYVALASRAPAQDAGTWDAPIGRAKDPRHRAVNGRDATSARTHFAVIARAGGVALLALAPVTGRTHQLRVHASHAGAPLLGDRIYRGPARVTLPTGKVLPFERIALHAARVTVFGSAIDSSVAPLLRETWGALGGVEGDWDRAIGCALPST